MRQSRQSNRSSFSGLSYSYSTMNRSRARVIDQPTDKSYFVLIVAITILIILQIYYIAQQHELESFLKYFWKGLSILLIFLILFSAFRLVCANQDQLQLKDAPLIPSQEYSRHIQLTTKKQIKKLKQDPRFIKLQKKSRKSSQRVTESDEQFFRELQDLESEFSFEK